MSLSPTQARKLIWRFFPIPFLTSLTLLSINYHLISSWTIQTLNSTNLTFSIILDPWGAFFSRIVLFISANVLQFTRSYIISEIHPKRFTALILLFILSINLLIFIPNIISLLLGWDGLGIISFILVIYYQNSKSLAAGIITALINRIGDVIILLSITLLLNLGHWSILNLWNNNFLLLIRSLILIAAFTKSAQIPFSSWLPAAIAAPTPVSALVHSSTLVTAGVFLLFRFHYTLHSIPLYINLLLIISSITMFIAGTAAIIECDIKKIIALSTLSQLGVIIGSLGLNLPCLTYFHLITHALFKALLFLTAGAIINFHHHSQDLRFIGNLIFSNPLVSSSLIIANLALCGTPFLAGFYSKDLILETSLFIPSNFLILFLFFFSTALTAAYSMRFLVSVIWNSSNSLPFQYSHDSTNNFNSPIIFLTLGAVTRGAIINWFMINFIIEPSLPLYLKLLPLLITIRGASLIYFLCPLLSSLVTPYPTIHSFISNIWFLVPISSQGIIFLPLKFSHDTLKTIDIGWIEIFRSQGLFLTFSNTASKLIFLSKNRPTTVLTLTFLGFMLLYIYFYSLPLKHSSEKATIAPA